MSGLNIGFNLGKNITFYLMVYSLGLTLGEDMKVHIRVKHWVQPGVRI